MPKYFINNLTGKVEGECLVESPANPSEHLVITWEEILSNPLANTFVNGVFVEDTVEAAAQALAALEAWRNKVEVSRFQAQAALYQAGYLETIQSYMDTQADPIQKMAWDMAQVFRRNSPTVINLQPLLGITDAQLDDLFKFALTIQA